MADQDEIRTTSSTGGEKGTKLARYDLVPVGPLKLLAEHYGKGALKYSDRNWERGYEWSKSYAALQRHANQFWSGDTYDTETGSHHMLGVIFHAMALIEWNETHPEFDDRAFHELSIIDSFDNLAEFEEWMNNIKLRVMEYIEANTNQDRNPDA